MSDLTPQEREALARHPFIRILAEGWADVLRRWQALPERFTGLVLTDVESTVVTCARCHQPVKGSASIEGKRYCHDDSDYPSCYMKESWERSVSQ